MSRRESPDEVRGSRPRINPESAAKLGKWGAQLAGYGVATIAITFMLLRPRRKRGPRGSLFLGSGIIMVLVKTLLSVSDGTDAAPAPTAPVVAAATPAPVAKPSPVAKSATPPAPAPRKRPVNAAVVTPPKPEPAETKPKSPAPAVSTTEPAKVRPTKTTAAPKPAPASKPAVAPKTVASSKSASPLGPRYADKAGGYSIQFPAGWTSKPSTETGWVLDATDGKSAVMSVGFAKFPADVTIDDVPAERVTQGLQKRAGTVVHSSGYGTVSGRRCLWHMFTGPITRGGATTKMTAVHYFLPLQDGRALELRLAAPPEKFKEVAPRMKQSVESFKLLTKLADARAQ